MHDFSNDSMANCSGVALKQYVFVSYPHTLCKLLADYGIISNSLQTTAKK